jgi:hypothetical protein
MPDSKSITSKALLPASQVASRYHRTNVRYQFVSASVKRGKTKVDIKLKRGENIWVLPDPGALGEASEDVSIEELDTSEWWCAEIVDCCVWQADEDDLEDVGYLRIAVSPEEYPSSHRN